MLTKREAGFIQFRELQNYGFVANLGYAKQTRGQTNVAHGLGNVSLSLAVCLAGELGVMRSD